MIDPAQMMAQPQQPTAPTQAMPGGGMGPQISPCLQNSAMVVMAIKRLAEDARMEGYEEFAITCEKAALEISRARVKKAKELQQKILDAQAAVLPQML